MLDLKSDPKLAEIIKTVIETQVIQALNSAPDAIDKLVKAALSKPVDPRDGSLNGYAADKVPYLEWLVGSEIRAATKAIVVKVISEGPVRQEIEARVRVGLNADSIVEAMTKAILHSTEHDYKIEVNFERERR